NLLDKVMQSYTGRIQIDGKVELQATFPPTVSIENVRIKNAKWGTRPDMMTAERIVAEIDLLPLLAGDMAVPRLRMIGVDIVVEQKRDGTTNWDELNNFETASGPADPSTLPGVFPSIGGATVSVVGGTLTILNAALSAPTVLSLGAANIISPVVPCL
ncbi:MAG: AsmA family protein, partial [Rhodospirillales bacterium]